MINSLCVIGHPSYCGGADTELFDQIKCWHTMGIKTYICHSAPLVPYFKKMGLEKLNCVYLKPRQWNEVRGMHCISFCNGEFLRQLRHIKKYARSTTFVNCMTWNFKKEIQCQEKGLIDFHLYQSDHGMEMVSKNLKHLEPYRPLRFKPFFDTEKFPFHQDRETDHFRFGRISRCDAAKFAKDQFQIYDSIESPVNKSGVVLGWGLRSRDKLRIKNIKLKTDGKERKEFYKNYIQLIKEGGITQQEFYKFCDVVITSSDTFENMPRIGFEAMSSGSILVVNNRGGWKIQVEDGRTGFLCNDTKDFIEKSTILAKNPQLRNEIRLLAREKLEKEWGLQESMNSWEQVFNAWEKL